MDAKQPLVDRCYDEVGGVPAPAHAGFALHQCEHAGLHLPAGRAEDETPSTRLCAREPSTLLSSLLPPWGGGEGAEGWAASVMHLATCHLGAIIALHRGLPVNKKTAVSGMKRS